MKYVIGLDIGIGSVGWAVVRNEEDCKRIEDFGCRIFETSEKETKESLCQERRKYRSFRRQYRRRSHRKLRLKRHLQNIGLIDMVSIQAYFESGNNDAIECRVRALDGEVSPAELAAALIHICNRRGYLDFYADDEEDAEAKKDMESLGRFKALMREGGWRTPAETIANSDAFNDESRRHYRNGKGRETMLVPRDAMVEEVKMILRKQAEYYPCLSEDNTEKIISIIFSQRDFEDGPGDVKDPYRRYKGFLDSLGKCSFYPTLERGSRYTAIADVYAFVNAVSQYHFVDNRSGEVGLPTALAAALISHITQNAGITKKELKDIAKQYSCDVSIPVGTDSTAKCIKFMKFAKQCLDDCGYDWADFTQDFADENGKLNQIGIVLSHYVTPHRREKELEKLGFLNKDAIKGFSRKKASGTASVSYRYMKDAIDAFMEGDIYGKHQAMFNAAALADKPESDNVKLPPFDKDSEFFKNPIVSRSISETRRVVNAIISRYGSPMAINIEVASELNKSSEQRKKDKKDNDENEKARNDAKKAIAELLGISQDDVKPVMIEKYQLGEIQEWKCLYSGEPISMEDCLRGSRAYEIDHIVPYSLILDNTRNNKALVLASENQEKRQRTPLMYLEGDRRKAYIGKVNAMYQSKKIIKKKFRYLMLETLDDSDLLADWKSRNINDTRYIAKYLVSYLSENLKFADRGENDIYRSRVYAVKSAITSMCRRRWLNKDTWGTYNKGDLKDVTYLDHAVDAVVIANCLPAYVEVACANIKLQQIYKRAGGRQTAEYTKTLEESIKYLSRFYGFSPNHLTNLLTKKAVLPSLCPKLRDEVDVRFVDPVMLRYFEDKRAEKEKRQAACTCEDIETLFRIGLRNVYPEDAAFVDACRMPTVSYKVERKVRGKITKDTLLRITEIDGKPQLLVRKEIGALKRKDVGNIFGQDNDLKNSIKKLFDENNGDDVRKILNKRGEKVFVTEKGNRVHTVTLVDNLSGKTMCKRIDENNKSILKNDGYYCIEFYTAKDNKLGLRGIAYCDLVQKGGKLYLKADHVYPEDYLEHRMYVYKNEYIELTDDHGNIAERSGFYRSVDNINQGYLITRKNSPNSRIRLGTRKCVSVKKYEYDVLGYRGGEVRECGKPLSLIGEKN